MHRPSLLLFALSAGCASSAGLFDERGTDGGVGDTFFPQDEADGDAGDAGDAGSPGNRDTGFGPPEGEGDDRFLAPAQTDAYVFVANPARDTVTRVDVATQEVRTRRVGVNPSAVEITPDYTTAVVFNKGDDTVSILDAETLEEDVVAIRDNMNTMRLSPNGRWAILWYDVDAAEPGDSIGGAAASFHEVSLVDVTGRAHQPMVVGFNPKGVVFTPDGSLALVVSDASLAVIDLTGSSPVPDYIQIADPLAPPSAQEVVIAPDGTYAFVRQFGTDAILVVDLELGQVDSIPVGVNPTDLDLLPDGLTAVVVSRGAREVTLLDVADPFATPKVVPFPDDTPFGSLLPGLDRAILFTNATPVNRYATWDFATDQIALRPLAKPVQTITRTPNGDSLLVVHTVENSPDGSTPIPYRDTHAISLVDLDDLRANTIALSAEPTGFVDSRDGERGYLIMEDLPYLEVLNYRTLIHDEVQLRSSPVFVGVLPDLDLSDDDQPQAWVSQEHPLGRISFFDPDDARLETITGFELNSEIEE